jgi:hypothetical protein
MKKLDLFVAHLSCLPFAFFFFLQAFAICDLTRILAVVFGDLDGE